MKVKVDAAEGLDVTAYAYQQGDAPRAIVLLNKTTRPGGEADQLSPSAGSPRGPWQSMILAHRAGDIAAKTDVTLGGAAIDPSAAGPGSGRRLPPAAMVA
jgi:hypothetical protein